MEADLEVIPNVIVQMSIDDNLMAFGNNSFIRSAYMAYSNHHHLTIRPDDVWIAIVTQFSFYANANGEALRDKFVDFQGKKRLEVQSNGTLLTLDYMHMADLLITEIANNITDPSIREWVRPSFTTTTATDRMVGAVALMATIKSYFDYDMRTYCGLPKVTLYGSQDDWQDVKVRAARLTEFEIPSGNLMTKWLDMLSPVLDQFIATASQCPDPLWWNRIVKNIGGESGKHLISGWITVFTVFTEDGQWIGDKKTYTLDDDCSVEFIDGQEPEEIVSEWPVLDLESEECNIPSGYLSVPITIHDDGEKYDTQLYAGHIGIRLPNKTTISPQLDWCLHLTDKY
eukprot:gene12347-14479_t